MKCNYTDEGIFHKGDLNASALVLSPFHNSVKSAKENITSYHLLNEKTL